MVKLLFLLLFTLLPTLTLASNTKIFYQDDFYIYRSIPSTIDIDDNGLMTKLIQAGTEEILKETNRIISELDDYEYDTTLEEVQHEIASYLTVQKNLDALNNQINTLKNSRHNSKFKIKNLYPKALTISLGLSGAASFGPSVSGSIAYGLNIMIDKVDRISKKELINFLQINPDFSVKEIADIFKSIDENSLKEEKKLLKDTFLGGEEKVLKSETGSTLTVISRFELDIAHVVVAAPAIGVGVGGGGAVRLNFGASWWGGNKILEPEDLYGLGLAYSQDFSFAGVGYNLKVGPVNSDNVTGWMDYFYASFSFAFGPQTEFSPVKANVLFMKQPLWLLEKIGVARKAEDLLDQRLEDSFDKEWEKVTGIPIKKRKPPRRTSRSSKKRNPIEPPAIPKS